MAATPGQDPLNLAEAICAEPWRHDFFQAIRHLECTNVDFPRVGRSLILQDDAVRFGQLLSLAFAPGSLAPQQPQKAMGERVRKITVEFTGLTGPNGPLPLRLTEFIRNRLRGIQDPDAPKAAKAESLQPDSATSKDSSPADESPPSQDSPVLRDTTLADFLDVFHHRMIALFYRAWAVSHKTVDFDRMEDRTFAEWTASLCGLGLPEFDGLDSIPTSEKLPFTGQLACQTRHAGGLAGVLAEVFCTAAAVHPFTGHWLTIPEEQRCRLGKHLETGVLGKTCVVGARIWDRNLKFTVHLGPMTLAQFESFLPAKPNHRRLHEWIDFYTHRQFYWNAVIILKKEEVPKINLGRSGRLGYTSWLGSLPFQEHPHDYQIRGGGLTSSENS